MTPSPSTTTTASTLKSARAASCSADGVSFTTVSPLPQCRLHFGDRYFDLAEVAEHALDFIERGGQRLGCRHVAALHFPRQVASRLGAGAADLERMFVSVDQPTNFFLFFRSHSNRCVQCVRCIRCDS